MSRSPYVEIPQDHPPVVPVSAENTKPLTAEDRARYEWQMWTPGFGEAGQRRLKNATVLISRVGGVGGVAAYQLAAAGVGRLILAHGGSLRLNDLNRQLLMTTEWIGRPRIESAARRLRELNPDIEIITEDSNINTSNAARLAAMADLIIDAAPLFEERFELNHQSVLHGIPMVEAAVFGMELSLAVLHPPHTPCLRCLTPEIPPWWKREFPVFGAVAGTAGCLAAAEAIKIISGCGQPLTARMLRMDLGTNRSRTFTLRHDPCCPECSKKRTKVL